MKKLLMPLLLAIPVLSAAAHTTTTHVAAPAAA